jgi:hypothetical protein
MNETFDSSAEKPSPWDQRDYGHQSEGATGKNCWKENLKGNLFIILVGSVVLSFMLGYYIAQQQETAKREKWAEILFRQAKSWLTESGRKAASAVEHGRDYARSAVEQASGTGAEYSRRLNPFHRELPRRFFGLL